MRKLLVSIFLTTGCVLLVTSAEAAPVANLPLTCSTASAIGQPQDNCGGDWSYETPTAELIVLKGPSATATWIRASNLTSSDTVNVCTLPVEPGTYSNCRDAAGVRRYAFVPKSQVFPDSSPPPASGGARILDLSTLPVEITEPGVYVLNRSWDVATPLPPGVAIVITADNVTLDFQGFELLADVPSAAIRSSGGNVTIRNGGVRAGAGTTHRSFRCGHSHRGDSGEHSARLGYPVGRRRIDPHRFCRQRRYRRDRRQRRRRHDRAQQFSRQPIHRSTRGFARTGGR